MESNAIFLVLFSPKFLLVPFLLEEGCCLLIGQSYGGWLDISISFKSNIPVSVVNGLEDSVPVRAIIPFKKYTSIAWSWLEKKDDVISYQCCQWDRRNLKSECFDSSPFQKQHDEWLAETVFISISRKPLCFTPPPPPPHSYLPLPLPLPLPLSLASLVKICGLQFFVYSGTLFTNSKTHSPQPQAQSPRYQRKGTCFPWKIWSTYAR